MTELIPLSSEFPIKKIGLPCPQDIISENVAHWSVYKIWPIKDTETVGFLYSREDKTERTSVNNLQI